MLFFLGKIGKEFDENLEEEKINVNEDFGDENDGESDGHFWWFCDRKKLEELVFLFFRV